MNNLHQLRRLGVVTLAALCFGTASVAIVAMPLGNVALAKGSGHGGKDSGGVDFPRIQQFLIDHKYSGWVTLDLDASMIEGKDMEETLKINIRYLTDVLGVNPAEL